nr:hypothetical protein [Lachnospiraceae bacterium]
MNNKYFLRILDILFVIFILAVLLEPMVIKKIYYSKLQNICQSQKFEYIRNYDWNSGIYSDRYILTFLNGYEYRSCMMYDLAKVYKAVDNYFSDHTLFYSELPDIYFEINYDPYIEFYRTSDGNWYMDTCADLYFENWNALEGFAGMQSITGVILENDSGLREADPTVWEGLEKLDVRISDKYISQQECDEVV